MTRGLLDTAARWTVINPWLQLADVRPDRERWRKGRIGPSRQGGGCGQAQACEAPPCGPQRYYGVMIAQGLSEN